MLKPGRQSWIALALADHNTRPIHIWQGRNDTYSDAHTNHTAKSFARNSCVLQCYTHHPSHSLAQTLECLNHRPWHHQPNHPPLFWPSFCSPSPPSWPSPASSFAPCASLSFWFLPETPPQTPLARPPTPYSRAQYTRRKRCRVLETGRHTLPTPPTVDPTPPITSPLPSLPTPSPTPPVTPVTVSPTPAMR